MDAFTADPFGGNPAAVVLPDHGIDQRWLQRVAGEMNLSETAFVWPDGPVFRLRWFTPLVEVELCGHATLAAAHVLWEEGILEPADAALFDTISGRLAASRLGDGIEMDFPAEPPEPCEPLPGLLAALGDPRPEAVARNRFDVLVELASEDAVRTLKPDFERLRAVPLRGTCVTAPAGPELMAEGVDFVSRFFAPAVGVNEDPVTGSAHCTLVPYWSGRLGKRSLFARQVSARGGELWCEDAGERVRIGGRAVKYLEGTIDVPA